MGPFPLSPTREAEGEREGGGRLLIVEERPFERLRSPSQILQRKEVAARSFSTRFSEASHRNAFLIEKIPFWPIACMYRISACMTMSDNLSELASRVNSIDIRTDRLQKWARLSNPHCGGTPLQGKHADFRPQTVKVKTGAVVLRCDAVRVDSWTEFEFLVDISRMSHRRTATAPTPPRCPPVPESGRRYQRNNKRQ